MDSPPASEIGEEVVDVMDAPVDTQELPTDPPSQDDQPEISLHALAGVTAPQIMQVRGYFKKLPLTILIDSGSTHNFIDPWIAKQADCFIHPCSNFEVMVANGGTYLTKGSVVMCVSLWEIITSALACFP